MAYIKNYTKQEWVNLPEETTPLSAERLTHMENGIGTLDNRIVEMSNREDYMDRHLGSLDERVGNITAEHYQLAGRVSTMSSDVSYRLETLDKRIISSSAVYNKDFISRGRKEGEEAGFGSIAFGTACSAPAYYALAFGSNVSAKGVGSFATGNHTVSAGDYQHVQGSYNLIDETGTYLHIIGNGWGESTRSNAHTVDRAGNAWYAGEVMNGAGVSLTALKSAVDALGQFHAAIVEALPAADIQTNTIYMIRKVPAGEVGDIYDEYLNLDGTADGWEYLGSTGIDLTEYAKKTELPTKTSQLTNDSGFLTETDKAELLAYVDAKLAELAGTT